MGASYYYRSGQRIPVVLSESACAVRVNGEREAVTVQGWLPRPLTSRHLLLIRDDLVPTDRVPSDVSALLHMIGQKEKERARDKLPVDRQFVQIASQGRPPELRFRFAGPCAEGRCINWHGSGCGIAAQVAQPDDTRKSELPNCGIRPLCRRYRDRGESACAVCPEIVRGSEEARAAR